MHALYAPFAWPALAGFAVFPTLWCSFIAPGSVVPGPSSRGAPVAQEEQAELDEALGEGIQPEAAEVFDRAAAYLSRAQQFAFTAEMWFDVALDDEVKIQYLRTVEYTVRRPNGLHISVRGAIDSRELWYDGETVTYYSPEHELYASAPAPGDIDSALAHVSAEYGMVFPLQDLALADVKATASQEVLRAAHVGMQTLGGVECDHILVIEEELDWQLWVNTGEAPLPRRLVLTFKNEPLYLGSAATFVNWDFTTDLGDRSFTFVPPPGAMRTEFEK